jgi:two-component system cell cycle sensor histidine kinase/response regulator CckA
MLAGGIAHDFNNLLAGILLTATELERESSPGSEQAEKIAHIVESARRGASLTQRLLQFARGRVRPSQGVDLGEELPDLLDMLSRTLGRNLDWQVDIEPDLPPVPLDEGELEQVLVNLCVNARDAMAPRGGRISVRAGLGKDGRVFLQVQDNGPGIPAHLLPRVFEPFVTTKGSSTGTGLGLAVVYGIAKGRGGEARVESPPGEGATVTLLLPALTAPAAESAPPERTDEPAPSGLRVLLVDDEPVLRTGLARALRHRGFDVLALEDGEAAVAWMEQQPDGAAPVDAVVMDMVMPGLDGVAAASALRSRWPGLPVVISSGYTGKEGIEPLLPTGPTLLLEKPYQPDDLLRAIGRVASA